MWAVYRSSLSIMAGVPSQDERSKNGAAAQRLEDDTSPPLGNRTVNERYRAVNIFGICDLVLLDVSPARTASSRVNAKTVPA